LTDSNVLPDTEAWKALLIKMPEGTCHLLPVGVEMVTGAGARPEELDWDDVLMLALSCDGATSR
jgi:hypothetical protein